MGPTDPRRLHAKPDIEPARITPIDIVFLTEVEVRAALVHLAGAEDPVVRDAVVETVRRVIERTRPYGMPLDEM
jgi:hypothetical protein